jgi:ABC-type nitrate/sulfonate/bicarbonate transport system substrate-binding protein
MKINLKLQIEQVMVTIGLLVLTVVLTIGCNSASQAAPATPKVQTSIQFSWLHTIEFVGFYEAIRQNYYADAGLEVRLDGGGFDADGNYIDPVKQVMEGKSDFGITGADVLLAARAQGQPIVAVAAIYQRSPVVLISLPEKNVIRPQDLIGKRVDTEPGTTVDVAYRALLASQNIDRAQIIETPRTDFTVAPLFNNSTDVLSGFITNDGVQAQQRREDVKFILMSDYGIDIYSNVIFTTEDMINNKPDLVKDFVAATVKGMQWAVNNPEQAAENVLTQYGDSMEPDIKNTQLAGLLISIPLLNPAGSRPGMMTPDNWELAHQFLLDQEILQEPLDIETAYNLTFVEAAYSNQ